MQQTSQTIHNTVHLREDPYTRVLNSLIKDSRLSFKARGLIIFMLSMPKDWETRVGWIEQQTTEGREAIRSALIELETLGYLKRVENRHEDGRFSTYTYHWFDYPENTDDGKPSTGSRQREAVNGKPSTTKEREETKENKTPTTPKGALDGSESRPDSDEGSLDWLIRTTKTNEPETRIKEKLNEWFKRRVTTKWSKKELKSLKTVVESYDGDDNALTEDLDKMEWYYTVSGSSFLRRDILTLLNNWQGELDRATNFTE